MPLSGYIGEAVISKCNVINIFIFTFTLSHPSFDRNISLSLNPFNGTSIHRSEVATQSEEQHFVRVCVPISQDVTVNVIHIARLFKHKVLRLKCNVILSGFLIVQCCYQ